MIRPFFQQIETYCGFSAFLVFGCLCLLVFAGQSCAAEEHFGRLRALAEQADLLEETKRVRRLEAEIAELEARTRAQKEGEHVRQDLEKLVEEKIRLLWRKGQGSGARVQGLPRVLAIERGARGSFAASVLLPDGERRRVRPGERLGPLTVLAISRERVLVREAGRTRELAFGR